MSAKRLAVLSAAALLATALLMSGCAKPAATPAAIAPTTVVPTNTAEPTQTSVEPSATAAQLSASGPITTPAAGSATRKALLAAARTKLGTTSTFYVHQLYLQGDTALGDIEALDNSAAGRVFVAWEKRNGAWVAIGETKFGSASASAASTARALPSFSAELIGKIDWRLAKPSTTGSGSASSMKASLTTAAKAWANTAMEGKGTPYKATLAKVAKDSKGVWWGHIVIQPTKDANNQYEPLNMWAKYSGNKWTGSVQDPEPPAPSTYFPSSVISQLGL
jgi:hypothetical protein